MIEKIIPDKISFTLPTVFGEELTFLEFCGRVRAKLNECIDVVNDKTATIDQFTARIDANAANINTVSGKVGKNTADIQKNATAIATNTTNIQKNATAISANQSNIAAISGKVDKHISDIQKNTTDIQDNAAYINTLPLKVAENILDIRDHDAKIAKNKESISTLNTSVEALRTDKVDKVEGKGLSTNDYTDSAKELLETWMPQEFDRITERVGTVEANAYNNYLKKVSKVEGKRLYTNDYTDEDEA